MLKGIFGGVWLGFSEAYETCDGMIFVSPEAYEPVALAHTKEWLSDSGRHAWAIGPLLPPSASNEAIQGEASQSQDFAKIQQFMQDALSTHGERSMLYVRSTIASSCLNLMNSHCCRSRLARDSGLPVSKDWRRSWMS